MDKMVKLRRGQKTNEYSSKTLAPAIKQGKLLPSDELFIPNKGWMRLDKHPQLAPLFASAPPTQPAAKPAAPNTDFLEMEMENPNLQMEMETKNVEEEVVDEETPPPESEEEDIASAREQHQFKELNLLQFIWDGRYPLWKTFWLFFVLGNLLISTFLNMLPLTSSSWLIFKLMFIGLYILAFIYYVFTLGATWKSAGDYGDSISGTLARTFVVLQFMSIAFSIITGRIGFTFPEAEPETGSYSYVLDVKPEDEDTIWAYSNKFNKEGGRITGSGSIEVPQSSGKGINIIHHTTDRNACITITLQNIDTRESQTETKCGSTGTLTVYPSDDLKTMMIRSRPNLRR